MLDFTRLAETAASFAGAAGGAGSLSDLTRQVAESGLDPAMLQGLDPAQIMELLGQHGIDTSALDPALLTGLAGNLGDTGGLAAEAGQWLLGRLQR